MRQVNDASLRRHQADPIGAAGHRLRQLLADLPRRRVRWVSMAVPGLLVLALALCSQSIKTSTAAGNSEVIDVHTERLAAAEYRLPGVILWLLCVIALTGLALTGFGSGLHGRRSMWGIRALAVLVVAVILSIIALDSPQQRFIRLSQTSLIQLRDRLRAETTTTALPQPAPPRQRDTQ
jgi:hypothetical protein